MKNKTIIFLSIFIISTLFYGIESENEALSEKTINRIVDLCKIWGKVRYFHPYILTRSIDWDTALIQTYPKIKLAENDIGFKNEIKKMLSNLNDPLTHVWEKEEKKKPPSKNEQASRQKQPYLRWIDKDTALFVANDYQLLNKISYITLHKDVEDIIKKCQKARLIIFDIRNLKGVNCYYLPFVFSNAFSFLLKDDLKLPAIQFITHLGIQAQADRYIFYQSGIKTIPGGFIRPMKSPDSVTSKFVFILNQDSIDIIDIIMALQQKGLGIAVVEGKPDKSWGILSTRLKLSDGTYIKIRTSERIYNGRVIEFIPDLLVKQDAIKTTLKYLHKNSNNLENLGKKASPRIQTQVSTYYDKSYPEMVYPPEAYRILGLFRFWNSIHYFFPYKTLMDQKWEDTLREFIPKFIDAKNKNEYVRTIAQMSTRLQDSHVKIKNRIWNKIIGTHRPPVGVSFIEGRTIITYIEENRKTKKINFGDILLSVDGLKTESRRKQLKEILSSSTPGMHETKVDISLLMGPENSQCRLLIQKPSFKVIKVNLKRSIKGFKYYIKPIKHPVFKVFQNGFGYVDLCKIKQNDVEMAFKTIKDTPGLILDMRGYPDSGTFFFNVYHLNNKKAINAKFHWIYYGLRGRRRDFKLDQSAGLEPKEKYQGQIVVLINSYAQSAAEHTCLWLEGIEGLKFVGSPTSGANGMITNVVLPGSVTVRFTGVGVMHGDGRQLQRMGIQPDVLIYPTIKGIREGRDEILTKGMEVLKKMIGKSNPQKK